jgi:hypothetical protein
MAFCSRFSLYSPNQKPSFVRFFFGFFGRHQKPTKLWLSFGGGIAAIGARREGLLKKNASPFAVLFKY